jgi:DNA invertase Pin-like site-specific DNA recombinase
LGNFLSGVVANIIELNTRAMGRFLLTQMASVAELEAGLISERTKAALAAAKVRGVKLGNPNGARALKGKQVGNKQAVAVVKANAEHRAANLQAIVEILRSQGFTSVRAIATQLNERGILTPVVARGIQRQRLGYCRGCKWRTERRIPWASVRMSLMVWPI